MYNPLGNVVIFVIVYLRCHITGTNRHFHFSKWVNTPEREDPGVYVFDWRFRQSATQCMEACKVTKGCQFFNYETGSHLCGLIRTGTSSKVEVELKLGYIFGNKSEWIQSEANLCDECDDTGRCNNDDFNDLKNNICTNSGCEAPTVVDIKGNMFSVESKVKCKVSHQEMPFDLKYEETTCTENGIWSANTCLTLYDGSYYRLHKSLMTWHEAEEFCVSYNGHLVYINSDEEGEVVSQILSDSNLQDVFFWIGANDLDEEGIWRWSDSSLIEKWPWGYADNSNGMEHCAEIVLRASNICEWNDNRCNVTRFSICEFYN